MWLQIKPKQCESRRWGIQSGQDRKTRDTEEIDRKSDSLFTVSISLRPSARSGNLRHGIKVFRWKEMVVSLSMCGRVEGCRTTAPGPRKTGALNKKHSMNLFWGNTITSQPRCCYWGRFLLNVD
ncbi:hypothetical protein CH063_09558 [Colletotrichum higginsianum]|uniref:Uncharacterized protein n=1 Tax=Colletotrichum higginsianum (strain IMI 349063) TaxID=759273 RepID=H1VE25_COLHI|nr:hypothetical protein CH63R_05842 [Colletotrichum higginsianum IMI 349063]OBR10150.1 hypothetical protein CH63R_05842 [Colletotrichum higginsianum IMI 349063]CCF38478.1 hypothetical protein CH063_09558 [Colletotrichum higginsianum]